MNSYLPILTIALLLQFNQANSQVSDSLLTPNALKKLSLKELLDVEVISVSKHPEKLTEVASAIQVITQQDIRNSGAKTLPEALRLASNLQVAQINSSQWAISARGFNNSLANKLLVLIDGRTVYTPLYAGVFWDVQNLVLDDIDRIEVISGPGGTLWGVNAVNGVINIITKNSKDSKGLFVEGLAGSNLPGMGNIRYGGSINNKLSYRIYGMGFKLGNSVDTNKLKVNDQWSNWQGGARLDWDVSAKDKLSLLQGLYKADPNPDGKDTSVLAKGDYITARWNHIISGKSDFQLQVYYDHTFRDFGNGFTEDLKTYDIEWQHRNQMGRHQLTYGLNFRHMDHRVTNLELSAFLPANKKLYNHNAFVQDEITLNDRLRLTVGSKAGINNYTDFEYQPNIRVTWLPSKTQTVWGAVSRSVRTPSRIDREFYLYRPPNILVLSGSNFDSEKLIAYELGWRSQPIDNLSVSLATFYNRYDNIRSIEPGPPPFNIPFALGNGVKGVSYGSELSATWQVFSHWLLRGGYTFFKKDLSVKSTSMDVNNASAESNDPEHQFLIRSVVDITRKIEWGTLIRYIGKLPKPAVKAYTGLDVRIGWKITRVFEINLIGQNLLNQQHQEFIASSRNRREIERGLFGKVICRL
ncbi:MAG TPA: TonB-dependent receptor [Niastella sp.]